MRYQFEFRPYRRRFKPPLQTSHGNWDIRDGVILGLSDETGTSSGEIAPISWFGSETMEQALDFCRQLPAEITDETIFSVPDHLPACQFGFESAWEELTKYLNPAIEIAATQTKSAYTDSELFCFDSGDFQSHLMYCGLLSAGEGALEAWQTLWNQGYRTFKWKIGVYPMPDEIEIFHALTRNLPASAKLRLDANGGLSYQDASYWLWTCDRLPGEIEFIEQPLPVEQFEEMQELSSGYRTAIALDESVATLKQLKACYQQGWRGIFVIKPCIAGSPSRLRQFCREHQIDIVFSSVFETTVGRKAALKLATELSHHRAIGFGINHWFDEDEN